MEARDPFRGLATVKSFQLRHFRYSEVSDGRWKRTTVGDLVSTVSQRRCEWRLTGRLKLNMVMWTQMKNTKGVYLFYTGVRPVANEAFLEALRQETTQILSNPRMDYWIFGRGEGVLTQRILSSPGVLDLCNGRGLISESEKRTEHTSSPMVKR